MSEGYLPNGTTAWFGRHAYNVVFRNGRFHRIDGTTTTGTVRDVRWKDLYLVKTGSIDPGVK